MSSTIRITRSGAACSQQSRQTPSVSSALTDPASKALVRTSDAVGDLAISAVSTPADASAIAAVRPAEAKFNELLTRRTNQLRVENV